MISGIVENNLKRKGFKNVYIKLTCTGQAVPRMASKSALDWSPSTCSPGSGRSILENKNIIKSTIIFLIVTQTR